MAAALGHPAVDPHGDPIPDADGSIHELACTPLADVAGRRDGRDPPGRRARARAAPLPRRRSASCRASWSRCSTASRSAARVTVEVGGRAARHRAGAGAGRPLRVGGQPMSAASTPPVEELGGLALSAHACRACPSRTTRSWSRGASRSGGRRSPSPGPGYMVAVGYMDPGNWATDLAGGARFGYTLLSVILISNLMAILLQALALKLGIVDRARPGAGLPRPLLAPGELRALGAVRDRHRRVRPRRGDRLGDRAQPAVRHSADLGRLPHRARRAADPAAAEQGLPLPRGVRHRAGGDDRRLLRGRAGHGAAGHGRGAAAACCRAPRSSPTRRCSTSRSASWAPP